MKNGMEGAVESIITSSRKMSCSFSRCSIAFLLALLALVETPRAQADVTLNAQEQIIANHLINDPGQQRPFLQLDPILTQVARSRALDMGRQHYFGDVGPNGEGPDYQVQQAGYVLPAIWGTARDTNYIESIAAGESSADATWRDWMNSGPHRQHVLGTNAAYVTETSYGVGYAAVPGSPYTYYWVVITAPPNLAAPAVHISSPAANSRVTDSTVTVSGATSGNKTVQSVQFWVGDAAPQTATGTTSWSGTATGLVPGPNTIHAQSLGLDGGVLATTSATVIYGVPAPLTVNIAGSGNVTAGFAGTSQRDKGVRYTIKATPTAGNVFQSWSGSVTDTHATLSFVMADGFNLTANFIANPYPALKGSFTGLLSGSQAGKLHLQLTANGAFTFQVREGSRVYIGSGRFDGSGNATASVPAGHGQRITFSFTLDLQNGGGVAGSLAGPSGSETFSALPAFHAAPKAPYAKAGRYTVSLQQDPQNPDPSVPQGAGYATLVVAPSGRALLTGALADGASFSAAGQAAADNSLALYTPLYKGQGSLSGSLSLNPADQTDLDGTVRWVNPSRPQSAVAPAAFDATLDAFGSAYTPPAPHTPVLAVTPGTPNSKLHLDGSNLTVTQTGILNAASQFSWPNATLEGLSVTVNVHTGVFTGSFLNPNTRQKNVLHGVIFKKQNAGYGYFLGGNESGSASLASAQ